MQNEVSHKITEHLSSYGIRCFDSLDDYWEWVNQDLSTSTLPEAKIEKLGRLQDQQFENPNDKSKDVFLNHVGTEKKFCQWLASMQYDEILASARYILEKIENDSYQILDLGCSFGYLTTLYGRSFPASSIVGFDKNELLVAKAREMAPPLANNVKFISSIHTTKNSSIDFIVDTQCLSFISSQRQRQKLLTELREKMKSDSLIFSVSAIPSKLDLEKLVYDLGEAGLQILDARPLTFQKYGEPQGFTALTAQIGKHIPFDIDTYWKELQNQIHAASADFCEK